MDHPDFKSLDPNVRNATDMEKKGKLALFFQYRYWKRTTPMEFLTWDYQCQEIDINQVDRLYYISNELVYFNYFARCFLMVGRMQPSIYFALIATYHENLREYDTYKGNGGFFHVHGSIYFTHDPQQFINVILKGCTFLNKQLICESLKNDGICVKENTDDNSSILSNYNKHPTNLENLCYETIYQNDVNISLIPKRIKNNVYSYIKMRDWDLFEIMEFIINGINPF